MVHKLTPKQIEVGSMAIKRFCLSSFFFFMGFQLIPMCEPILLKEMGIEGVIAGIVLALPCVVTACVIPFIPKYFEWAGIENAVLQCNLGFALSMIGLGFGLNSDDKTLFLVVTLTSSVLFGMTFAASICTESFFLLKYSPKEDREKNVGIMKAASGLGGLGTPVLVSLSVMFLDYWAAFLFVAVCLVLVAPFIFSRMN